MKGKDEIKDLFSNKLGNFEAKVNPELWGNIASQIGGGVAASSTGLSILSKWLIGLGISGAAVVSVVVLTSPEESPTKTSEEPIIEQYIEQEKITAVVDEESFLVQKPDLVNEKPEEVDVNESVVEFSPETIEPQTEEEIGSTEVETEDENKTTEETLPDHNEIEIVSVEAEDEGEKTKEELPDATEIEETKEETTEEEVIPSEPKIVLPNFFSPNNDGDNDVFFVTSEGLSNFNIVILNDRNQTVFQSNDPNFIWGGLDLTGNAVPKGNYLYFITADDLEGNPINKSSMLRINK